MSSPNHPENHPFSSFALSDPAGGAAEDGSTICGCGGGGICADSLVSMMPNPSIMAKSSPPTAADFPALRSPCLNCSTPPVSAPEAMEFHGSSFFRTATSAQSNVENSPPHTAKLPPMRGASRLSACVSRHDRIRFVRVSFWCVPSASIWIFVCERPRGFVVRLVRCLSLPFHVLRRHRT